jgi:hypothetical protein
LYRLAAKHILLLALLAVLTLTGAGSSSGGRRPSIENTPEGFERYTFTRERMRDEVMYRREQQWKVFSWISSLYLAIIGGVIVISSNELVITISHKVLLTIAVFIFAVAGTLRISHDASVAKAYAHEYHQLDKAFGLMFVDREYKKRHLAHIGFLWLLAIISWLVIWISLVGKTGNP